MQGSRPREQAGPLDERVEDAVGVVEQAVELVLGGRPAAALEAEPLGQGQAQRGEVLAAGDAFQPHERAAELVDRGALEPGDDVGHLVEPAGDGLQLLGAVGTGARQVAEQPGLMADLGLDPLAGQADALLGLGDLQQPAPQPVGRAQPGVPEPPVRLAVLVQQRDVDVVLQRQPDRVGREMHARRQHDRLHLPRRHQLLPLARADQEHVVLLAQARAEGVEDELHGGRLK